MPMYMLDTDTVSFALRGVGNVTIALVQRVPTELWISSITLAELRYGAERRQSNKLHALIDTFTRTVRVAPFDEAAAMRFGQVGATLAESGVPIGQMDTMIAAHALSLGLTLVTNNSKHFGRVSGLRLENWVSSS
jgi:tRNA(fMet)-specific endonuclease VapC